MARAQFERDRIAVGVDDRPHLAVNPPARARLVRGDRREGNQAGDGFRHIDGADHCHRSRNYANATRKRGLLL